MRLDIISLVKTEISPCWNSERWRRHMNPIYILSPGSFSLAWHRKLNLLKLERFLISCFKMKVCCYFEILLLNTWPLCSRTRVQFGLLWIKTGFSSTLASCGYAEDLIVFTESLPTFKLVWSFICSKFIFSKNWDAFLRFSYKLPIFILLVCTKKAKQTNHLLVLTNG